MEFRLESDFLGKVKVTSDKYWGAQTQRALENFNIGGSLYKVPEIIIKSYAIIKKSAAKTNKKLGTISKNIADAIVKTCDEILENMHYDQFPLSIFQSGSGTNTNMNINEVIANRACEILGKEIGSKFVHPNNHVNYGQSTNDTFPTAMHIALIIELNLKFYPEIKALVKSLNYLKRKYKNIIKSGRTHLMDAVPIKFETEINAWITQIKLNLKTIKQAEKNLYYLPIGGTAVGNGITAPKNFSELIVRYISEETGFNFKVSKYKASQISSHNEIAILMSEIKNLSLSLFKMANDIRLLASGPDTSIGEILLPANEPGSSIMPGKVNPSLIEALTMVILKIVGNELTVSLANSQGILQLNIYKPIIIFSILDSIYLLTDSINLFRRKFLKNIKLNNIRIKEHLEKNKMLITLFSNKIGYDKCAEIIKKSNLTGKSIKEVGIDLGYFTKEEYNEVVYKLKI